jgi:hypothetical protein
VQRLLGEDEPADVDTAVARGFGKLFDDVGQRVSRVCGGG